MWNLANFQNEVREQDTINSSFYTRTFQFCPSLRKTIMNEYIRQLLLMDEMREPTIRQAMKALHLPPGSRGLDVGCGSGALTLALVKEIGSNGHVTGLDSAASHIAYSTERAKESSVADRVSFQEGSMYDLPFEQNSFDWAWSVDCVGYSPLEPKKALSECQRVVKPGGIVALLAWSSEKLLPGYPRLEGILSSTKQGYAPFKTGMPPGEHFSRAMGWFSELGFKDIKASAFAGSVQAPLSPKMREALIALFDMRWNGAESELSEKDAQEFRRLIKSDSEDFILNLPDYYMFFNYSMFWGVV